MPECHDVRRFFVNRRLTVLHVHGAHWHFRGLDHLCARWGLEREQIEYSISKPLVQALGRRDWTRVCRELRNGAKLFRLCYSRDQVIVLSIAPFDVRLPLFHLLARRHRFFLHCSWAEWVRGPFPKRPKYFQIRAWFRAFFRYHCHGVFAVSRRNLQTLRQMAGFPVPGLVVNHAITEDFHPQGRVDRQAAAPLRLISVGRLVPSKGLKETFELMDRLDPQRFQLTIVGYGELEDYVAVECARRDNCSFHGRIHRPQDMAVCYRKQDVLLLPSLRTRKWQELFGMVTIEAMACGVVPICTDHVGSCEILSGQSAPCAGAQTAGFLTSEEDFITNAARWCQELAEHRDRWHVLSQAAIQTAQRYTDAAIGQRWQRGLEAGLQDR